MGEVMGKTTLDDPSSAGVMRSIVKGPAAMGPFRQQCQRKAFAYRVNRPPRWTGLCSRRSALPSQPANTGDVQGHLRVAHGLLPGAGQHAQVVGDRRLPRAQGSDQVAGFAARGENRQRSGDGVLGLENASVRSSIASRRAVTLNLMRM